MEYFAGLDVSIEETAICVVGDDGKVVLETAVETGELIQVGAFGNPTRDPRGRNISIAYAAVATSPVAPAAGDDASQAAVFPLSALPSLAFDHD
ncbi:MAG: hypothetical protein P8Y45_22415, partial [Exilibacterium sp.]